MNVKPAVSDVELGIAALGAISVLVAKARRRRLPPVSESVRPALLANTKAVEVPSLGSGVTSVVVVRLMKRLGDPVAVGEPIMELSTDKADIEVPSSVSGVVAAVLARENDEVPVGFPVFAVREESA